MRPSSVVGEAWRNLSTGTSRAAVGTLALTVLVLLCALADARAILDLDRRTSAMLAGGGATIVLSAAGSVAGESCDALADEPGIVGSGAVRTSGQRLVPSSAPGTGVPVVEVTEGLVAMLDVELRDGAAGVLLSTEVADGMLGADATTIVDEDGSVVAVRGVYAWPEDGRGRSLAYAALAPTRTAETFDECWATVWPMDERTSDLITSVLLASAEPPSASTSVLNTSWGTEFRPRDTYLGRDTRFAPWVAAVAGLVLGGVLVRLRRVELASARQAGVQRLALVAQLVVEASATALVTVLVGLAVLVVVVRSAGTAEPGLLTTVACRSVLAGPFAFVVATAAVGATARAASLFRDVRSR